MSKPRIGTGRIPFPLGVSGASFTPIRAYGAASYRDSFAGAVLLATVARTSVSASAAGGQTGASVTGQARASVAPGAAGQVETRATGQSSIALHQNASGAHSASSARGQPSATAATGAASEAEATEGEADASAPHGSATES